MFSHHQYGRLVLLSFYSVVFQLAEPSKMGKQNISTLGGRSFLSSGMNALGVNDDEDDNINNPANDDNGFSKTVSKLTGIGGKLSFVSTESNSKKTSSSFEFLPFPTNAEEFLAMGLSHIGRSHTFLGLALKSNATDGSGNEFEVGEMVGGAILTFGEGIGEKEEKATISIKLTVKDIKMINGNGGLALEYDTRRQGKDGNLVVLDPTKTNKKFTTFLKAKHLPKRVKEFTTDRTEFFHNALPMFQPYAINLKFNIRVTLGGTGKGLSAFTSKHSLINKKLITMSSGSISEFPPNNMSLSLKEPIILIDKSKNNDIVGRIEEMNSNWVHPFDEEKSEAECQAIANKTLTFDTIRDLHTQYLQLSKSTKSQSSTSNSSKVKDKTSGDDRSQENDETTSDSENVDFLSKFKNKISGDDKSKESDETTSDSKNVDFLSKFKNKISGDDKSKENDETATDSENVDFLTAFQSVDDHNISSLLSGLNLPFPIDPGEFWSKGMASVYGTGHFLIGMSPDPNVTDASGAPINVGPLFGGIIVFFGGGLTTKGRHPKISIRLSLKDVKLINLDGGFAIELDSTRPGEDSSLVSMDPILALKRFAEFLNPMNWKRLKTEFESDVPNFFKKYVNIFAPFGINLSFNVQSGIGPPGSTIPGFVLKKGLVNDKPIWIKTLNQLEFPPNNLGLSNEEPIVLVDIKGAVGARIESMHSVWVHPFFESKSEAICQAIVAGSLSYNTVREFARKFIPIN